MLCSGTSEPHLKAITSELQERLHKEYNVRATTIDGLPSSHWVVADFSDVVVHVFHTEKRGLYCLEELWSAAPRLALTL